MLSGGRPRSVAHSGMRHREELTSGELRSFDAAAAVGRALCPPPPKADARPSLRVNLATLRTYVLAPNRARRTNSKGSEEKRRTTAHSLQVPCSS